MEALMRSCLKCVLVHGGLARRKITAVTEHSLFVVLVCMWHGEERGSQRIRADRGRERGGLFSLEIRICPGSGGAEPRVVEAHAPSRFFLSYE